MQVLDNLYQDLPIERDRDQFLRELIRELAGTIEDTVGLTEAEGFISVVGGRLGSLMGSEYQQNNQNKKLNMDQLAAALVDLKRRINGSFSIESISETKIVLINKQCPFGDYVIGRQSLCMMTSNVFGRIAADNMGYARVEIVTAIARGDSGCRVIIDLSEEASGREYFS